jgi:hypothetical protein
MTISTTTCRIPLTSTGVVTFGYTFRILDETHLKVYVDGVLKTLTTHYTVTGVGVPGGGNVVFGVAPTAGAIVVICRDTPRTQETDYVEGDAFPAESHEQALDKLTMIVQEIRAALDLAGLPIAFEFTPSGVTRIAGDPDTTHWGTAEGGRVWFNTVTSLFKGWSGTAIVLL